MIEKYFPFTEEQLALIEKFYEMHANAGLNLTAIKNREDFYQKHVLDSFLLYTVKTQTLGGNIADVGTGGGFPGMILAIMYPDKKFTLIDSIAKKCRFLEEAVKELGLKNVRVITSRSEDIKGTIFDTILTRGVAKVDQIIKYTWNLAGDNCVWVLYKGENVADEIKAAEKTLKTKRLEYINVRYDEPIQRTYTLLSRGSAGGRLHG